MNPLKACFSPVVCISAAFLLIACVKVTQEQDHSGPASSYQIERIKNPNPNGVVKDLQHHFRHQAIVIQVQWLPGARQIIQLAAPNGFSNLLFSKFIDEVHGMVIAEMRATPTE